MEKQIEKKKKRKDRKNGGGREGTQKHTRNKTREMLDDISKLRTWKCVRIHLQAPADCPAESEPINTQEQQTRLATKGNLQERYRESLGTLQETLGTPMFNVTLLPRHAGKRREC